MEKNISYFELRKIEPNFYEDYNLPFWVKHELKSLENTKIRILDFGCGFGQYLTALKKEGYLNVYGIDIDEEAIKHCRNNGFDVRKIEPNDLNNPFPLKFDVIFMFHVIEHIDKSKIIPTLKKIKTDFLNEGGYCW